MYGNDPAQRLYFRPSDLLGGYCNNVGEKCWEEPRMVRCVKRGKCQNLVTRRGWIMQEKGKVGWLPEPWFGDVGGWCYYLLTKEAQEEEIWGKGQWIWFGRGEFLKPMKMSHYAGLGTKREVCARQRKWGKSAAFRAHFNWSPGSGWNHPGLALKSAVTCDPGQNVTLLRKWEVGSNQCLLSPTPCRVPCWVGRDRCGAAERCWDIFPAFKELAVELIQPLFL